MRYGVVRQVTALMIGVALVAGAARGSGATGPPSLGDDVRPLRCNDIMGMLTVVVTGKGTVTGLVGRCRGQGRSISCPGACTAFSQAGQAVALTAGPREGYALSRWSGACYGTNLTCRYRLHGGTETVRATFVKG